MSTNVAKFIESSKLNKSMTCVLAVLVATTLSEIQKDIGEIENPIEKLGLEKFYNSFMSIENLTKKNKEMALTFYKLLITDISNEFNITENNLSKTLNIDLDKFEAKKPKKEGVKYIPLPFDGIIRENCCFALKKNLGLYTQCTNPKEILVDINEDEEESKYCKTCNKQMAKKDLETPEYGTVQMRVNDFDLFEYVDPKGCPAIKYCKIMKKFKVSKEELQEYLAEKNININEGYFNEEEEPKKTRKPKSKTPKINANKTVNNLDDLEEAIKKVVSDSESSEPESELKSESEAESESEPESEPKSESEPEPEPAKVPKKKGKAAVAKPTTTKKAKKTKKDDDDDEITLKPITVSKVKYCYDEKTNKVYDFLEASNSNLKEIGTYDSKTKKLELFEE